MSLLIPKAKLDEIRFANPIEEVIGRYLQLRRAGSSYKCLCPFHKEKTPSFTVNPARQSFHCFGCGAGGDVFRFVMQHENLDFMSAVRLLAERAGLTIEMEEGSGEAHSERKRLYDVHAELARFYQRCLQTMTAAQAARDYLNERDLAGAAEDFGIGYAPDRWDTMAQWAAKHSVPFDVMEKAGLVVRSEKPDARNPCYDRFRGRLMFPIHDEQGRIVGFSGRVLVSSAKAAKYVNSPETPIFRKGRLLYAMHLARKAMADNGEALLCEGQIDVIRCHLAGFGNAVASQGTAFTEDHARIIRRYADGVVVVFDGDRAGEDSAVKAARVFLAAGLAVRIASLPPGEDPDSLIRRRGADVFRQLLEAAQSVVGFQIRILGERENLKSQVGAMRAARQVIETVATTPNPVQRTRLLQEAAQRLNVPVAALDDEFRYRERRQPHGGETVAATGPVAGAVPAAERFLCEYAVQAREHPEVAALLATYVPERLFTSTSARLVLQAALAAAQAGDTIAATLDERVGDENERNAAHAFLARCLDAPARIRGDAHAPADAVKDMIAGLWLDEVKRRRDALEPGQYEENVVMTGDIRELKRKDNWDIVEPIIRRWLENE